MNRKWRNNGVSMDFDYSDDHDNGWESGQEYIMTTHGLEKSNSNWNDDDEQPEHKERKGRTEDRQSTDSTKTKTDNPNGDYRYHKEKPVRSAENITYPALKAKSNDPETSAVMVLLSNLG